MMSRSRLYYRVSVVALASFITFLVIAGRIYADVTINILAVNGTEENKEKDIRFVLPPDLGREDIVDPAGLKIDYDVAQGAYFVYKQVTLKPKETKTFKVRVRDVWKIDGEKVENVVTQIEASYARLKDTEYYDTGVRKRDSLKKRLNSVLEQQELYENDVQKRIDSFQIYAKELDSIRSDALSINYWRSQLPDKEAVTVRFIIEAENPSETEETVREHQHYLPEGVNPQHVIEAEGFDVQYDAIKGQTYVVREDKFQPGEKKRFSIEIFDVWNINQTKIDNLKERTRKAYKFLENTDYIETANYLVKAIKGNLEKIEVSQSKDKDITRHISDFRLNEKLYTHAQDDVEALENLLQAVREELERSKLKNVLLRIKSLSSIADIAESVFKKPTVDTSWKIIAGIMIFVAIITVIHFVIWGKKSSEQRKEEEEKEEEDGE